MKDDKIKRFSELDIAKRKTIASRLHSHFGQPLVAAKSFANAITRLDGDDKKLLEAKEMASLILQMTEEVYAVTYDLMMENDPDEGFDDECRLDLERALNYFSKKIRLEKRGIQFETQIDSASINRLDEYLERVLFDCLRALILYIARYAKTSYLRIEIEKLDSKIVTCLSFESGLTVDKLNREIVIDGVKQQLLLLNGNIEIISRDTQFRFVMRLPVTDKQEAG